MTRETKIGLLMGLGFIVVFAVLLLQTGPKQQQADEMSMLVSMQGESAARRPESGARLPEPVGQQRPSTVPSSLGIESVSEALTEASEPGLRGLPNPPILNSRPDYSDMAPNFSAMTENLTPEPRSGTDAERIVPGRVDLPSDARPSHRPDEPDSSPPPGPLVPPHDDTRSPRDRAEPVVGQPTPYVVQKGDSFSKIARKHYNTDSTSVLDFLVRFNSDKVKGRDWVVEGQTLLIPVLPANLKAPASVLGGDGTASREPVHLEESASPAPPRSRPGLRPLNAERVVPPSSVLVTTVPAREGEGAASRVRPMAAGGSSLVQDESAVRSRDNQDGADDEAPQAGSSPGREALNPGGRERSTTGNDSGQKHPDSGTKSPDKKAEEGAYRWYTIQPKDTLSSIADKQLGSKQNWEDIAKLNKNIKPTRLQAGQKIRLPSRKLISQSKASSVRSST